jgi:protein-tyrosine phosphatase
MLPGLDDGAATLDEAIAMAQIAIDDGVQTIVATPHQLSSHGQNSTTAILTASGQFQKILNQRNMPLRILPGADVRIEPELVQKIRDGEVVTLANRRRHVLLELPHDVFIPMNRLLEELKNLGITAILSHPERNRGILKQPDSLRTLVDNGCLLQVTAGSLMGIFGQDTQHFCKWMLAQGLVHFVSTDAHDTKRRIPAMQPAFERIVGLVGQKMAVMLCCINPAAVAAGQIVASKSPQSHASLWKKWFCR